MTRPGRIGRPGYLLLAAATVSRLAEDTAPVALVLLVITRTRDVRAAGLLVAAFTVPTLLAGPVLGAYLDRLHRRRRLLFAASQVVLALDLACVLVAVGHVSSWLIAALAFGAGVTTPLLTGGYSSLVPLVIPAAALGRANALDAASYGLAGVAGPAVVSAFAGGFGVTAGFTALVAVAAAGVPLVLLAPVPAPESPATGSANPVLASSGKAAAPGEPLPAAIADGLRLLRRSGDLLAVTIATTAGQFFQGPLPVLLPLLALALGRPLSGGGWLLTAFSVGGLLGALASERLIARWPTRRVMLGSLTGLVLFLALLAGCWSFWLCLLIAALAGVADGPGLAATLTVRQAAVPPERYAQLTATAASLKLAAYSAGSAVAGLLTGLLTVRELLLGLAAGELLAVLPMVAGRAAAPTGP